ncbi:MAG TPA: 30S ribosomal protein S17 [archaeon]|nr:30S ribosomal protein S17 [archaeon]
MTKEHKKENAEKNKATSKFSVRGAILTGMVVSAKAPKTVTVERRFTKYIPKYERYKKSKSKIKAHNPEEINAKEGDVVTIGETRKLSKTKSFVVLNILKRGEQ